MSDKVARGRVIVVGGGWSGLAAAVELSGRGYTSLVLEASRQLGGRARAVRPGRSVLDNGQHLLVGACRELTRLLDRIGAGSALSRRRLRLPMAGPHTRGRLLLTAAPLPPPFHLLWGLATARGLDWRERWALLRFGMRLNADTLADRDTDALSWLRQAGQPERMIERLWSPLCLAALNTPVERASARTFRRVLAETLAAGRRDSDLLFPNTDLSRVFPLPAAEFVESRGGRVRLATRVSSVMPEANGVAVVTENGERFEADDVVLALPPFAAARLLRPHPELLPLAERLSAVRYEPITTVFLTFPGDSPMSEPLLGLYGTTGQWLVDRTTCGNRGVVAAVISADGPHMGETREALGRRVVDELAACFPRWPAPQEMTVLRERRATFASHVGVDDNRPDHQTPVAGLWIAGDYAATGYPATLEGAVRSGVECARRIARRRSS